MIIYLININNMFDIEIRNFKDYNTCMLSIKKPNSKTYIIPILDTIELLFTKYMLKYKILLLK